MRVAVLGRLVGHDRHEADLRVLLFDEVLAGLAPDLPAEEDLQGAVERVDLEGVLGAEQLHAEPEARSDVAPARRRLDDEDLAVLVPELDQGPGEILGRAVEVIGLSAAVFLQDGGVFRLLPLEAIRVGRDRDGRQDVARRPRRRQHEAGFLDRVAHHVVEHSAALERSFPEPRHVRAAVLLGRPSQVGRAGDGRAPGPQDLLAAGDGGGEDLVFEITVQDPGFFDEGEHPAGFLGVAAKRFFAGHAPQLGFARKDSVGDFLHDFEAGEVGGADPEGADGRISGHGRDRGVRLGFADAEGAGQGAGLAGPFPVGIENAEDVGVADADEALDVEAGDEPAADDADAEVGFG
ncbi:MAG: hypothetical protein BWX98_02625 [Candidatus Aminicenantes bacterium ADurb.Bin147]|nr:MAG: hypothetical protein BWX98_02625 [Candidatus Aminicenantes bacterium ADurb.Bin147]